MLQNILVQLGFTNQESQLYSLLADYGPQTAPQLSKLSGIGRTYIYKLCQNLEKHNLLRSHKQKKTFSITSPANLQKLLDQKQLVLSTTIKQLDQLLPSLLNNYTLIQNNIEITYLDIVEIPKQTRTKVLSHPESGIYIYDDVVIIGNLRIRSTDVATRLRHLLP